ncbi:MAG TPA: hypothetical protein VE959_20475 [Bryobacteraceae bacterium]|nr:hypothetical protein [Bryobacteraceae bacterium]
MARRNCTVRSGALRGTALRIRKISRPRLTRDKPESTWETGSAPGSGGTAAMAGSEAPAGGETGNQAAMGFPSAFAASSCRNGIPSAGGSA